MYLNLLHVTGISSVTCLITPPFYLLSQAENCSKHTCRQCIQITNHWRAPSLLWRPNVVGKIVADCTTVYYCKASHVSASIMRCCRSCGGVFHAMLWFMRRCLSPDGVFDASVSLKMACSSRC